MHNIAQYGVAAHWKYKNGIDTSNDDISLDWLHSLDSSNEDIEEFYNDAKQDLYNEEIIVYSPKGNLFTLPRGATAYDFAYEVHTGIGNRALKATINNANKPLLTQLKSGDIVSIQTGNNLIPRCSWLDMVHTSKAKKSIKYLCSKKINEIDRLEKEKSTCSIPSKDGRFSVSDDGFVHQDCTSCHIPHDDKYIKNHFSRSWEYVMKNVLQV